MRNDSPAGCMPTPMSFDDALRFLFEPISSNNLAVAHLNFANVDSVTL